VMGDPIESLRVRIEFFRGVPMFDEARFALEEIDRLRAEMGEARKETVEAQTNLLELQVVAGKLAAEDDLKKRVEILSEHMTQH